MIERLWKHFEMTRVKQICPQKGNLIAAIAEYHYNSYCGVSIKGSFVFTEALNISNYSSHVCNMPKEFEVRHR